MSFNYLTRTLIDNPFRPHAFIHIRHDMLVDIPQPPDYLMLFRSYTTSRFDDISHHSSYHSSTFKNFS